MIDLGPTRHIVRQLTRGKRLWGLSLLSAVAGLAAWIAGAGRRAEDIAENYHVIVATAAGATVSIAMLVMGAAALRDERDAGTLSYLYLKPIARWCFALSAWAAAAWAAGVAATVGWAVGWVAMGLTIGNWTLAVPALSAYLAAAVGYTAIFVPVGYLLSRAVLVGLAYVFVWEAIITRIVVGLGATSVWRTALSIYADLTVLPEDALEPLGNMAPSVTAGVVKLAAAVVLGTAVLTWALKRRDAL
jgi:ABC-2 type transport system permease protein